MIALTLSSLLPLVIAHRCDQGDNFCQSEVSSSSYCKYWSPIPSCSGTRVYAVPCDCGTEVSEGLPEQTLTATCFAGDSACQSLNGPMSYCKFWMNGTPKCEGGNQDCSCSDQDTGDIPRNEEVEVDNRECSQGDSYCAVMNGDQSYCKYWLPVSVCSEGDQPCTCEAEATTTSLATTVAPPTTDPVETVPDESLPEGENGSYLDYRDEESSIRHGGDEYEYYDDWSNSQLEESYSEDPQNYNGDTGVESEDGVEPSQDPTPFEAEVDENTLPPSQVSLPGVISGVDLISLKEDNAKSDPSSAASGFLVSLGVISVVSIVMNL